MAGRWMANAVIMIFLFQALRKKFNGWDRAGCIPMTEGENFFIVIFFILTAILLTGKTSAPGSILLSFNLVCLAFSAWTDFKTGMLYRIMLYVPLAFNWIMFAVGNLSGALEAGSGGGAAAFVYAAAAAVLCLTKAIAAGDGMIYLILLPVILILEQGNGYGMIVLLFLSLVIPLLLFDLVEGSRMVFQCVKSRHAGGRAALRRPFAPYILAGFVFSLLLAFYTV